VEQIEGGELRFAAFIDARQREQILDQLAHAFRLGLDAPHRGCHGLVIGQGTLAV